MKLSIVVVDDDDVDRYIVKRLIKRLDLDAKLVEFADGKDFLSVLQDPARAKSEIGSPPPQFLVLLDLNMPCTGGLEVLEAINTEPDLDEGSLFVSMYTSSDRHDDKLETKQYPFVRDFIVKPLTPEKLTTLIGDLYA